MGKTRQENVRRRWDGLSMQETIKFYSKNGKTQSHIWFGRNNQHILSLVSDIVMTQKILNTFKNGRVDDESIEWWSGFIERWLQVRLSSPVITYLGIGHVSESNRKKIFQSHDIMPLCIRVCISGMTGLIQSPFEPWVTEHFVRHIPPARPALLFPDGHNTNVECNLCPSTMINSFAKCGIQPLQPENILQIFDTCKRHSPLVHLMLHESSQLVDTLQIYNVAIQYSPVKMRYSISNIFDNSGFTVTNAMKRKKTIVHARAFTDDEWLHHAGAEEKENERREKTSATK
ncbi:hypothetical protein ACJMK2_014587 [Sinanodonta woodiana]|uniref:Uncharacterized protein n=1 Tax=Sinanodonta woodiana TaxID=1069815 RepID=A0ABD3V346_SINWO